MRNLKKIRIENNFSQKTVANKLSRTITCISDWERGRTQPSIEDLNKLADIFNCSVDYLIGRTDDYTILTNTSTLSYKEKMLLKFFNVLNDTIQDQVIDYTKYQADKFINLNELKRS